MSVREAPDGCGMDDCPRHGKGGFYARVGEKCKYQLRKWILSLVWDDNASLRKNNLVALLLSVVELLNEAIQEEKKQ